MTTIEVDQQIHKRSPVATWEIVDVVFPAVADTDYVIRHSLRPADPTSVHYTIIRATTGGTVYESQDIGRKPPTSSYLVLRSDVASWKGRLLLFTLKTPEPFIPMEIV